MMEEHIETLPQNKWEDYAFPDGPMRFSVWLGYLKEPCRFAIIGTKRLADELYAEIIRGGIHTVRFRTYLDLQGRRESLALDLRYDPSGIDYIIGAFAEQDEYLELRMELREKGLPAEKLVWMSKC